MVTPYQTDIRIGCGTATDKTSHAVALPTDEFRDPGDLIVALVTSDGNPTISAPDSRWTKLGQVSSGTVMTTAAFWTRASFPLNLAGVRAWPDGRWGPPPTGGRLMWAVHWFGPGGAGAYSVVDNATDGPAALPMAISYARKTWTTAPTSNGEAGYYFAHGWNAGETNRGMGPFAVGGTYTVSAWVRCSQARTVQIGARFRSSADVIIGESDTATNLAANTWTRVSGTFTVPANTTSVSPMMDPIDTTGVMIVGSTLDVTALMITTGTTLVDFMPLFSTSAAEQTSFTTLAFKNAGTPTWATATNAGTASINAAPPAIALDSTRDSLVVSGAGFDAGGYGLGLVTGFPPASWCKTRVFASGTTGVGMALNVQKVAAGSASVTPGAFTSNSQVWAAFSLAVPYKGQFPAFFYRQNNAWTWAYPVYRRTSTGWSRVDAQNSDNLGNWTLWYGHHPSNPINGYEGPLTSQSGFAFNGFKDLFTAKDTTNWTWSTGTSIFNADFLMLAAPTTTAVSVTGTVVSRFTGNYAAVNWNSVNTTASQQTALRVGNSGDTAYAEMYYRDGSLRTNYLDDVAGGTGTAFALTPSTATELWYQIRHVNGVLRWEWSTDGRTWFILRAEADRSVHVKPCRPMIYTVMALSGTGSITYVNSYNQVDGWGYDE